MLVVQKPGNPGGAGAVFSELTDGIVCAEQKWQQRCCWALMELLQAEEAPALLCPSLMLEKPLSQAVAGGVPSGKGQGRSFDSKG